jgi:ABC-type branched-subunit amino acid transport system ATPase component
MLEVKGLQVCYGPAIALQGIDLVVRPGEMVFAVGRNGAGKTTLLRTISGLLEPRAGEIAFDGRPITGLSAEKAARRGIRFVAQDKRVFSALTVRSNIELAAYAAGWKLDRAVERVLALYPKMEKFLDSPAGGLSGGQREILLIGRALIGDPRLLLIDEPTEGLAAVVIKDIFKILNTMKEHQASVIVEQNLSVVSRLADRVYVIKEGKIIREIGDRKTITDTGQLEQYL